MKAQGPPLQSLTGRLAECPPEFLEEPGTVDVAAVVSDLSRLLGGAMLTREQAAVFRVGARTSGPPSPDQRSALRVALIASWLLADDWFRAQSVAGPAIEFLAGGLADIAAIVDTPKFVADPDRREELVRLCLDALGFVPSGESEAQSADRLITLNSVERSRVIRETRAAQERVRQVREAMKKKAAEEAAAMYGRE